VFEEDAWRQLGRVVVPNVSVSEPEPLIDGDMLIYLTEGETGRLIVLRYRWETAEPPSP
jgi:hypothetical protein